MTKRKTRNLFCIVTSLKSWSIEEFIISGGLGLREKTIFIQRKSKNRQKCFLSFDDFYYRIKTSKSQPFSFNFFEKFSKEAK